MATLTPQQAAAVHAEGNVLVMAGAGTGKTSTLVARVAERLVRSGGRVGSDRLLMVTFTEAAAQEMRSRLRREVEERVAAVPDDPGLAEQLVRLELAQIGTLHAFCLRLLREHGAGLGLDPQLAVIDEVDRSLLVHGVLRDLMEPLFRGETPEAGSFRALVREQFRGDVDALRACLTAVHAYARTRPDPMEWLARQEARWTVAEPDEWRGWLAGFLPGWAEGWRRRLRQVTGNPNAERRAALLEAGVGGTGGLASGQAFAGLLAGLAEAADEAWPARRKTVCREPLAALFKDVHFLQSLMPAADGRDPLAEDWNLCRGNMGTLAHLVRAFEGRLSEEKRARGVVDFADLEQFALELLVRGDGSVAAACRERFDLVVVDECQDLNAAQEAILIAVSREGERANRFLVGDVKQSIYRFRLADPHLFQRTADEWSIPGAVGRVLPLTENFRSAESLLGWVNRVFPRILRREVGGVDYGPGAALQFGDPAHRAPLARAADITPRVEVHLVVAAPRNGEADADTGDEAEALSTGRVEARIVATRLAALRTAATPVWDRALQEFRPVRWSDMAVLLRAERDRATEYVLEFRAAGIPLHARQSGFFERIEVGDLVAILQCLDNPLQDIPLVAVLRSPLTGLDDLNELATVRMFARREERWWTLVQAFHVAGMRFGLDSPEPVGAAHGNAPSPDPSEPVVGAHGNAPSQQAAPDPAGAPPLVDDDGRPVLSGDAVFTHPATAVFAARAWRRLDRLLGWYPAWRRCVERRGVAAVVEAVLDDTGYESRLERKPESAPALANVRRLLELARDFDRGQRGGLYRFLGWLRAQADADRLEPSTGAGGDAVQLLTIHRSKGLEFPVVAVGGLGRKFNLGDLQSGEVVRDEEYGLCPVVVAGADRRYPSLPLWLAQKRQRRECLGEELRLLYVAFTRPVDHLLLIGTTSEKAVTETWPEAADSMGAGPLPVGEIEEARNPLDWLGPVIVAESGGGWNPVDQGQGEDHVWRIWRQPPAVVPVAGIVPAFEAMPDEAPAPYPFATATLESAKVTVTGLRKRLAAEAAGDSASFDSWTTHVPRPATEPDDVSAVERGLVHHRFLEHVDPACAVDVAGVAAEVQRLRIAGRFTDAEAALLDVGALARFWTSPLGERIRAAGKGLRREIPFTMRLDAADLRRLGLGSAGSLDDAEFVVAQGVVDLAVLEADGLWLLDYKTDRVTPGAATQAKVTAYRPQLQVYALALGRIYGRKVTGCWLHFLTTGESVEIVFTSPPAG